MNWELVTAIVFYSIVGILIYLNRDKFEIMQKIFIVRKTKKGLNFMRSLAKHKWFWKIFSTIAIPVAVYWALRVGQLLWLNVDGIISGVSGAGVGVVIPGVRIPGSPIYIPFWQGIIAIGVLAIVHEFAHGIVAVAEGIKIKNTGFGFLAVIPLAFVEMDEKSLKKASKLSRLRMASSGAFMNICMWLIFSVILVLFFAPFLSKVTVVDGVNITGVTDELPADLAGVVEGSMVRSINGVAVPNLTSFTTEIQKYSPGENLTFNTSTGVYTIATTENPQNPETPYLGVMLSQETHTAQWALDKYGEFGIGAFNWFFDLVKWVAMLNFLVGIMNFLPIWALDGGMIFYDLSSYIIKKQKLRAILINLLFAFYLTLLLFNLIGPIFY